MLNTIYTGLAGMLAYSRGLEVISNNVANLNTPGFKSSEPLFRDLVFRSANGALAGAPSTGASGAGVSADTARSSFGQGELRGTNNPLDTAVDGNGFFILEKDGTLVYTRAGQFEVDKDGVLVDRRTKAKVMFSTDAVSVGALDIDPFRVFPPKATSEVTLVGNLARGGTETTFTTPSITVIDPAGGKHQLTVRFVRDGTDPLKWTAEVRDDENTVLGQASLEFDVNGTPKEGSERITATVKPTDAPEFELAFLLGKAAEFSGVTSLAGSVASQVQSLRQNGLELGTLTQFAFTDKGELKLTYSNGETKLVGTVLLARFDTPDDLTALGDGLFAASGGRTPLVGAGLTSGLGRVVGGQVELSNVDLTGQFTDLIIIQRGYQASSQMASTASEMMQQLLEMARGR